MTSADLLSNKWYSREMNIFFEVENDEFGLTAQNYFGVLWEERK